MKLVEFLFDKPNPSLYLSPTSHLHKNNFLAAHMYSNMIKYNTHKVVT